MTMITVTEADRGNVIATDGMLSSIVMTAGPTSYCDDYFGLTRSDGRVLYNLHISTSYIGPGSWLMLNAAIPFQELTLHDIPPGSSFDIEYVPAVEPPTNSALPVITPTGAPTVGTVLNCSTGTWTDNPDSYTYQWMSDGTAISGGTANSFTVPQGQAGKALSCQVTATNAAGSASATSAALPMVKPVNLVVPAITGDTPPIAGNVLACNNGTWTGAASYTYQWQRGTTNIAGATANNYTPVDPDDVGQTLRCIVTGVNAGGTTNATSNVTQAVVPAA